MKTTQKLDGETLERLRNFGHMGDSFDRVVTRLLDEIEDLEGELDGVQEAPKTPEFDADDREDN